MTPTLRAIPLLLFLTLPVISHAQPQVQPPDNRPGWNDDAQPTAGRAGIPTLHLRVQLVLQDVAVTDAAGHPVTNLNRDDFHIFEDGQPQTIKTFEEHAPIDPTLAEQRAAELAHKLPSNTFTNYKPFKSDHVVVFLLNIPDGGCPHLSEALIEYMKTSPPGTPFIVLWLDGELRMVQDMTTDRDALVSTAFKNSKHVDAGPLLAPEDPRYPQWQAALSRRRIDAAAMKQLQQYLGGIPGKKDLVWFAAGLGRSLVMLDPTTTEEPPTHVSVDPTAVSTSSKSAVSSALDLIYSDPGKNPDLYDPRILDNPKQMKSQPTVAAFLQNISDSLAQSRTALHIYQSGCDVNNLNVPQQIAAIVNRTTHYYTLSYTPTNQNFNDRPRQFSVQLADPNLRVDYRRTYSGAPTDTTVQRASTPAPTASTTAVVDSAAGPSISMQTAMGMGTVEPTQVVFEASATPALTQTRDPNNAPAAGNFLLAKYRKQGYRDYTVHFRVRANELKLTQFTPDDPYTGKLEFVAVVYDNQGQAVNGKREHASISLPNLTDPQLQTAEVTGDLVIQVPAKGSYFLRLGVHDTATDRVGALEIPTDRIPPPPK